MSVSTSANEVLLRHSDNFEQSHILFAGDMQSNLPTHFVCAEHRAHTQFYHHWQVLSSQMGERVHFSLIPQQGDVTDCDTLIYYWPKSKLEAQFQLMNLFSILPMGCDIFVIGENRCGVRSVEQMLETWVSLNKIDSARRCTMYHGRLEKQPIFSVETFWGEYQFDGLTIKTLPGVFSSDGLDMGSQLLLSILKPHIKGKVLDVGCGTGVLAAVLVNHSPEACLTLCDVSASAIAASRATLIANGFEGSVFASNVFSDITDCYDLIISNPPFHDGIETSLEVARTLIRGAACHLNSGGELCIVANAFLPYSKELDETFGFYEVIAQTSCFKVYRTVMTH